MEIQNKGCLEIIKTRKSVRHFTGEKVSRTDIETLLRAAMAAPAAMHMLPWKFIVVTEQDLLNRLARGLPFAKMLPDAGVGIIVCAAPAEATMSNLELAILDCACASENILLAAEAMGLGAVWTAVYPDEHKMEFVCKQLGIPRSIIPLNIIPVGYPTGEDMASEKFDARNIHWELW